MAEGGRYAGRYGGMLAGPPGGHNGISRFYSLDFPFERMLCRPASASGHGCPAQVTERDPRDRGRERDLCPGGVEAVIGAGGGLAETVEHIMRGTGLAGLPARTTDPEHR
ncbi:hypothetical protein [Streptomyces sp. NPDC056796]|uniref:hypothetical protein n=1 Tax=Streptomyces sp. NPDC056796 TaxID=3345947 RepID=UPI0036ACAE77